jgi:class 3 adenylate cyclase
MGAADFEAAGLYDPAAPDAADRLALLEWMAGRGISIEQMVHAEREQGLTGLAGDLALHPPGPLLTLAELASRVGVSPERLEAIMLAIGMPPPKPGEAAFSEAALEGLRTFSSGAQLFGEEATLRFGRVVGASLARIAEAAVALFLVNVEAPIREAELGRLALARANLEAIGAIENVSTMMRTLLRAHIELAIRRLRRARAGELVDRGRLAVGFVDLVGFTPLSRLAPSRDLAALIERFEGTAHDVATARDGRIVKVIGDEVMFVAVDAGAACDIALTLVERLCRDTSVTPRGGLAYGEMLLRGGDYYGPVVNLAARIAEQAVPNELLVTPEVEAHADGAELRFEPAGKRMLKGFDAPVTLMTLERG